MTLRLALILAAGAALVALGGGLLWKARQDGVASQAPKIEAATDQAVTNGLETEGARAATALEAAAASQRQAARETLAALRSAALAAGDANAPLPTDRADRLHAADRGLCDARPALAGCGSETGDPGRIAEDPDRGGD